MRALTRKDRDLLSHFENMDETENGSNNTSLKQMFINNHTEANGRKIEGYLPLEHVFGFCKTFNKITKNVGFHQTLKTNDVQDNIFTTIVGDVIVTINSLCLFVPVLIPITETQVMLIESI